jgi:hypothetical protein
MAACGVVAIVTMPLCEWIPAADMLAVWSKVSPCNAQNTILQCVNSLLARSITTASSAHSKKVCHSMQNQPTKDTQTCHMACTCTAPSITCVPRPSVRRSSTHACHIASQCTVTLALPRAHACSTAPWFAAPLHGMLPPKTTPAVLTVLPHASQRLC